MELTEPLHFTPTTVFVVPENLSTGVSAAWIELQIAKYNREDDIFRAEFLHGIILISKKDNEIEVTSDGI